MWVAPSFECYYQTPPELGLSLHGHAVWVLQGCIMWAARSLLWG